MGTVDFGEKLIALVQELNPVERGIMAAPNIDMDTQKIAPDIDSRELIFVTNASAVRASEAPSVGMACSAVKFYYRNHAKDQGAFRLDQVDHISYQGKNRFGSYSPGDKITVTLHSGQTHILNECLLGLDGPGVAKLLTAAATDAVPIDDPLAVCCLSLSELPSELQVTYMEILCNYAYLSDCKVDSAEYAALQSIMVRIELEAESRNKLRDYLFLIQQSARTKTGILLKRCRDTLSYGSYQIFRFSLMQDALYLQKIRGMETLWYDDPFINGLQQALEIDDRQIETMLAAIALYKEIQKRDANLSALNGPLKDIRNHAKALKIPLEAIFCSGSVYSIDTYRGLNQQWKLNRSITLQRELMLQAVIRNTQESLNHLVEDMNEITLKLLDEVQRGNQRDEQIQQLSQRMLQFQQQARTMAHKSEEAKVTRLYNSLPAQLSAGQIAQLLPQQQELVRQCYTQMPQGGYQIRENLSAKALASLGRIKGIVDNG